MSASHPSAASPSPSPDEPAEWSSGPVLLQREGGLAHIRFNRPEALNTIDVPCAQRFEEICRALAADPSVRAVVMTGEGRGFGAGGDISAFTSSATESVRTIIASMHEGVRILSRMDAPTVAGLHGVVAGGSMSLALSCDLAIAAQGTRFNLAYVNLAANCDVSGSFALPRVVGLRNAMQIALLGETFDVQEAHRLGLVNRVVAPEELLEETLSLGRRLAQGPTLALGKLKRLLRSSFDHTLDQQLDLEAQCFQDSTRTEDFAEAVQAFLAKRKPDFKGR